MTDVQITFSQYVKRYSRKIASLRWKLHTHIEENRQDMHIVKEKRQKLVSRLFTSSPLALVFNLKWGAASIKEIWNRKWFLQWNVYTIECVLKSCCSTLMIFICCLPIKQKFICTHMHQLLLLTASEKKYLQRNSISHFVSRNFPLRRIVNGLVCVHDHNCLQQKDYMWGKRSFHSLLFSVIHHSFIHSEIWWQFLSLSWSDGNEKRKRKEFARVRKLQKINFLKFLFEKI
jgi:hypothetical protein